MKISSGNLVTVDYVRDNNPNVDLGNYTDTTISGMISAASQYVVNVLGYDPIVQVYSNEKVNGYVNDNYDLVVFPTAQPIISVSAITLVKGTSSLALQLSNSNGNRYDIPYGNNRVIYPNSELSFESSAFINSFAQIRGQNFYTKMTYTAGYTSIPEDVKYAVSLIVMDRVAKTSNPSGASRVRQGNISIEYSDRDESGDSDNYRDAKQILTKYKRVTLF